ncbi:hypothetical protein [Streptomyces sp. NPDC048611]|uniref:hypothetical protein n=1 Tax=Streptomyces sp. NPDC048611 TaxID=3155635 RepID=UPI00343B5A18
MSQLAAIRDALKNTIKDNVPVLRVYDTVPEVANLPAVVVEPVSCDYAISMSSDTTWHFELIVMVPRVDSVRGQDELDTYVAAYGPTSIRKVIFDHCELGLADSDAIVTGMTGYGGSHKASGIDHLGAVLKVSVTTGTA